MNIGIVTFHWGTNHGAVLQAYALSEYLRKHYEAQVEVIDYYPKRLEITAKNTFRLRNAKVIIRKLGELKKEKRIKPFRKKLCLSPRYVSNEDLIKADLKYDVLLAGSDQIWNPSFLRSGEGKVTPVYFLNFGGENVKKVSVSASFGCERFPDDCGRIVAPYLSEFKEISVRENTGKEILQRMGFEATVTADPTALLKSEEYEALCMPAEDTTPVVSKMILRRQSKEVNKLIDRICQTYTSHKIVDIEKYSIPEWLTSIKRSQMVITNSFHCVMMCLKLHTPFMVVLEDGQMKGMNDRFKTLLSPFGLDNCIVRSAEDIQNVPKELDFERIDEEMDRYADSLRQFLERNIC